MIDTTRQSVNKIENQRQVPRLDVAMKLARALGRPVANLFELASDE